MDRYNCDDLARKIARRTNRRATHNAKAAATQAAFTAPCPDGAAQYACVGINAGEPKPLEISQDREQIQETCERYLTAPVFLRCWDQLAVYRREGPGGWVAVSVFTYQD
jgi:hypothetical protein